MDIRQRELSPILHAHYVSFKFIFNPQYSYKAHHRLNTKLRQSFSMELCGIELVVKRIRTR